MLDPQQRTDRTTHWYGNSLEAESPRNNIEFPEMCDRSRPSFVRRVECRMSALRVKELEVLAGIVPEYFVDTLTVLTLELIIFAVVVIELPTFSLIDTTTALQMHVAGEIGRLVTLMIETVDLFDQGLITRIDDIYGCRP